MVKALNVLHSLVFWSALIFASIILYVLSSLSSFFIKNRLLYHNLTRIFSRFILVVGLVGIRVRGLENIPRGRGMLLAANHPGFIDFLVHYAVFPVKFRFVLAYTFFQAPIIRSMVARMEYIPLGEGEEKNRRVTMEKSGAAILAALRNNEVLFAFPEGQRKKEKGEVMARFRTWTARVAQAAGVPVVPVAVRGSEKVLPKMKLIIRPGKIKIAVGKPIYFTKDISPELATEKLQRAVLDLYNTL